MPLNDRANCNIAMNTAYLEKFDFIAGIGRDCACSIYLRKHNLQFQSLPFDWLTNVGLAERFELILNDFEGFFELDDIQPLSKPENMPIDHHHDYYQNTKNQFHYYHDFKAGTAMEKQFPAIKEKYQRRIARLYDQIESSNRVLFVWFSHQPNISDDRVMDYSQRINEKFKKEINLFIFENNPNMDPSTIECKKLNNCITKSQPSHRILN